VGGMEVDGWRGSSRRVTTGFILSPACDHSVTADQEASPRTARPYSACMPIGIVLTLIVAMSVWMSAARSCTGRDARRTTTPISPEDKEIALDEHPMFCPAADDKELLVAGIIDYQAQTKSGRSYHGGDYQLTFEKNALGNWETSTYLRPTPAFPNLHELQRYTGKQVIVRGRRGGYYKLKLDLRMQHIDVQMEGDQAVGWFGGGLLVDGITIVKEPEPEKYPAADDKELTLRGYIIHQAYSESPQSWNAGAGDYYILSCERGWSNRFVANKDSYEDRRVILRTTPAFPAINDFRAFEGRLVEVRGKPAGDIPAQPDARRERYRRKDADGNLIRGGGVLADRITIIPGAQPLRTRAPRD